MKRATPQWAKDTLRIAGGANRFGDPNFRVTWGADLFDWIGGKWEDRDASGTLVREVAELRWLHKYPMFINRWIVERWQPPEKFGSPETWYQQTREWGEEGNIPQLGPYPSRGRYQIACAIDLHGKFVQLTPTILDDVVRGVIYKEHHVASLAELKQAQEDKEMRWAQESRDYLDKPAFNAESFVSVA